ncbi:pentatricopeptide repeat-containing protein At1g53600, mitochondrial [Andrographis paniculata]|uniref:pentatricopeptide repeat-containing protein At1g53600, mitochondrial n=1 Tax=Andrographis paniculata TaxID=175694 RepID=UPI0021E72C4B|nr:pentatricopeptide repeat-containing protein At1g53600, mitochondrial [Andrographis paniculata]
MSKFRASSSTIFFCNQKKLLCAMLVAKNFLICQRIVLCFSTSKNSIARTLKPYSSTASQAISAKVSKFVIYCNKQITSHGRSGNTRQAELLFQRMPEKTIVSYTAMLTAYANNGEIANARKLFDEMPQRTVEAWNAMITAYIKSKDRVSGAEEALRLFVEMPARNAISYTTMVMGFVNAGRFDEAERLYAETPLKWRDPYCSNVLMNGYFKFGKVEEGVRIFAGMVEKNVVSWSSMVDGYCKIGRLDEARKLFDSIKECANQFTWCSMIDGYLKSGHFEEGFRLFSQMREETKVRIEPTIATVLLESCGKIGRYKEGCQVHGLVSRSGLEFDVFLGNSIVAMYSRFGRANEARIMFDSMSSKDVVSWNSLIYGYVQAGRLEEAYELFEKADSKDLVSWTTLIAGFSNRGFTEKGVWLLSKMPEWDDVSWTALISGFASNGEYEDAIHWFVRMLRNTIKPNPLTLSTVLSASGNLSILSLGLQIHSFSSKTGVEIDLSIQNSLISMYAKCGSVHDAYRIFQSVATPNVVTFNSMVSGFAHNGYGGEALNVFRRLIVEGHEPNEVTFLGVLSACTHAGLVNEGKKFFNSMKSFFKIEPTLDHYACMVDLLGRAGLVDEASKLIASMPVEPHIGVWGALLGACRSYVHPDLAEVATRRILEIEPDNAAAYVALSDIYSFVGNRRGEEEVRLSKRFKGVKKSPGCSWITVRDKVEVFLSGDKSVMKFEEIKNTMSIVMHEMLSGLACTDVDLLSP